LRCSFSNVTIDRPLSSAKALSSRSTEESELYRDFRE
jgi:hypothetical protein